MDGSHVRLRAAVRADSAHDLTVMNSDVQARDGPGWLPCALCAPTPAHAAYLLRTFQPFAFI
jgi:hypothetical protein